MQYWTLASAHSINAHTYKGWDCLNGNIWHEDRRFDPIWTHTNCIMDAWQSRIQEGTMNQQIQIPILQIANIKTTIKRFEVTNIPTS